jgi:hypothetical protein
VTLTLEFEKADAHVIDMSGGVEKHSERKKGTAKR